VTTMFVLLSEYRQPPQEVADALPRHSEWIAAQYECGRLLVSGRRRPATGGLLVARGESRVDILAWIANDPFVSEGVATYDVYEFDATDFPKRGAQFEAFANAPLTKR
jgi:uncharacterized protein YciI